MNARNAVSHAVVALLVVAAAVESRAQIFVNAGSTDGANQTIGNSGSMAISSYSIYWNFGASPNPNSLVPLNSAGATILTNPAPFITGSSMAPPLSGTNSSSGYQLGSGTNASGGANWGLATSYPAVSGSASPSFKITLNAPPPQPPAPPSQFLFDVSSVQLGSRSGASGPTTIALRYNYDDYQQDLATASVTANGTWQALNFSPSMPLSRTRQLGLFGMNGSGTFNPFSANWQIDDLRIAGSLYTFTGGSSSSQTYAVTGTGVGTFSGNFNVTGTALFTAPSTATLLVDGPITGYGSLLQKNGPGLLVLSQSNSFVGQTVITAGTVQAGHASAFGGGPIAVNDGATLDLNGFAIGNRIINRGAATILNAGNYKGSQVVTSGTVTYAQIVSGSMTIGEGGKANFSGGFGGNLMLSGSTAMATLAGQISGTVAPSQGAIGIITGTVDPGAFVQVGEGGKVQFGTGLQFQQPTLPNQGLVELTNSGSLGLATSISGTGGFTMAGAGLAVLSGSSSFSGGTMISSGSLQAANPYALGQGPVTVSAGGRFILGAALALGGSNTVTLDPGAALIASGSASAPIAANSPLGNVSFVGSGSAATAALLAGIASGSGGLLASDWLSTGKPPSAMSDILDLKTPTGTSPFVLSMQYDPLLVTGTDLSNLWLGWQSGSNGWVNAVDGNIGNNASPAQQAFVGSFAAFQGSNGSSLTEYLGAYGRDASTNTVWAVVNHNSEFVALVPEPGTVALAAIGAAAALAGRHRVRRRHSAHAAGDPGRD